MRLIALISMLMLTACASGPAPRVASQPLHEPSPPAPILPSEPAELRYNPARCPCTPWEIKLEGGWARVQLIDGSEDGELLQRLEKQTKAGVEGSTDQNPRARVELLEELSRDNAGHTHAQLLIREISPPEEATAPPARPVSTSPSHESAPPESTEQKNLPEIKADQPAGTQPKVTSGEKAP